MLLIVDDSIFRRIRELIKGGKDDKLDLPESPEESIDLTDVVDEFDKKEKD